MGPLVANSRRLHAMEGFVSDAIGKGAKVQTGGSASATRAISTSRPC
jgi:succinate-semialdehyde dehydrogenase/glutarate-semialdehyde dehydrogenase